MAGPGTPPSAPSAPAAPGAPGTKSPVDKKAAEELAAVMGRVAAASQGITASFQNQLNIIQQMKQAMSEVASSVENLGKSSQSMISPNQLTGITQQLRGVSTQGGKAEEVFDSIGDILRSKFTRTAVVAGSALSGLQTGFSSLVGASKSILGFLGSVASAVFELGAALLALPFSILNGLTGMAQSGGGGGGGGLAEAIEEVRARFGDMNGEMSKTIFNTAKFDIHVKMAGISAFKAFGPLPERLKKINATISAMGNAAITLLDDIKRLNDGILAFNSGLGISDEMMPGVAAWVTKTGQSMSDLYIDITKQSKKMAAAMGINAKVMSSDMAKAMNDAAHFGHIGTTALAGVAAYTQKLGISVEKLTGMMDKFDTFEGAADSASSLNSVLGTNIDAMELMNRVQDGSQLDYLRQQFAAAGKDISKMDYHTRKLVASASGLDQVTIDQAFGQKNASVQMKEFKDTAEATAKETWSMDKALKSLTNDIQRFVGGGGGGDKPKTFFEALMKGFTKGIQAVKPFQELMRNIQKDMIIVEKGGHDLGKMFMNQFPGMMGMLEAVRDMFSPAKFKKLMEDVKKVFKDFLDPSKGAFGNVDKLLEGLKKNFLNFFDSQKPEGRKFLDNFEKFSEFFIKIMSQLAVKAIDGLANIINWIVNWMQNPEIPSVGGINEKWAKILEPLKSVWASLVERLWPAIKAFGAEIWKKIGEALSSTIGSYVIEGAMVMVFGPAIMNAILGIASQGILLAASNLFAGKAADAITDAGADKIGKSVADAMSKAPCPKPCKNNPLEAVPGDAKTIEKLENAGNAKVNWAKLGAFLVGLAGVIAIGLVAFLAAAAIAAMFSKETLLRAGAMLLAIGPIMFMAAKSLQMVEKIKINKAKLTQTMLSLAAVLLVGVGTFAVAALIASLIPISALIKTVVVLTVAAAMFYAFGVFSKTLISISKQIDSAKLAAVVISMGVGILAIAFVMWGVTGMLGGIDPKALGKASLAMLAGAALFAGFALISNALQSTKSVPVGKIFLISLGIGAVALVIAGLVKFLGNSTPGQIAAATVSMLVGGALFAGFALISNVLQSIKSVPFGKILLIGLSIGAVAGTMAGIIKALGNSTSAQIAAATVAMAVGVGLFAAANALLKSVNISAKAAFSGIGGIFALGVVLTMVMSVLGLVLFAVKSSGANAGTIAAASVAFALGGALFYAANLFLPIASAAGKFANTRKADLTVGMLSMAAVIGIVAGTMWGVVSLLGSFPVGSVALSVSAMAAAAYLFTAAALSIAIMGSAATIIKSLAKPAAQAFGILAGFVIVTAGTMWAIVQILGNISAGQLIKTMSAMASMGLLMLAGVALVAECSALSKASAFVAPALLGLGTIGVFLLAVAFTAQQITSSLSGVSEADFNKAITIMAATELLIVSAAACIAVITGVGLLITLALGPAAAGLAATGWLLLAMGSLGSVAIKSFSNSVSAETVQKAVNALSVYGILIGTVAMIIGVLTGVGAIVMFAGPMVAAGILGIVAAMLALDMLTSVLHGMLDAGEQLVAKSKKINMGDLMQTLKLLGIMAAVYAGASIVASGAMTLGALMIGSAGILYGAIHAGLGVIGEIVTSLMGFAELVINKASSIGDASQLKPKIEAIVEIMKGVAVVAGSMGEFASGMGVGGVFVDPGEVSQKIGHARTLVNAILGTDAEGGGIVALLNKVGELAGKVGTRETEGFKSVGALITALGGLMGSVSGPMKEMSSRGGMLGAIGLKGFDPAEISAALVPLIEAALKSSGTLIDKVAEASTKFSGVDKDKMKAGGEAINAILGGLGGLAGAIKPADIKLEGLDKIPEGTTINISNAGPKLEELFTAISNNLPRIVDTLIRAVRGVKDPKALTEKIDAIKGIFSFLKDLTGSLKDLQDLPKSEADKNISVSDAFKKNMDGLVGVFDQLANTGIKGLSDKMTAMGSKIDPTAAKAGKKAADFMKDLAGVVTSIKEAQDAFPGGEMNAQWITTSTSISTTLTTMAGGGDGGLQGLASKVQTIGSVKFGNVGVTFKSLKTFLTDLMGVSESLGDTSVVASNLSDASEKLEVIKTQLSVGGGGFADKLQTMTAAFTSGAIKVDPLSTQMKSLEGAFRALPGQLTSIGANVKQIEAVGLPSLASAAAVASQLSAKMAEISQALGGASDVNITAKLSDFAGRIGSGSVAKYSLQASKDVTITINMTVHLDAGATATAVANANSVLKTTINNIIDKASSTEGDGAGGSRSLANSGVSRLP